MANNKFIPGSTQANKLIAELHEQRNNINKHKFNFENNCYNRKHELIINMNSIDYRVLNE